MHCDVIRVYSYTQCLEPGTVKYLFSHNISPDKHPHLGALLHRSPIFPRTSGPPKIPATSGLRIIYSSSLRLDFRPNGIYTCDMKNAQCVIHAISVWKGSNLVEKSRNMDIETRAVYIV